MKRIILLWALLIPMFAAAQAVNVDPDSEVSQGKDTVSSALEAIFRAALEGNATAQTGMGVFERELGGDPLEAIQWFRKAADQGHALGQYSLGDMYRKGEGIPQDYKEALKWFRKAANQDEAYAQFSLGNMYFDGEGVTQDYKEALVWFRKAADQGHASAQFNLGVMYTQGNGVIQDYMMAHMYINLAASNGQEDAAQIRAALATIMTPDQIGKAQQMAREWMDKHPRQ